MAPIPGNILMVSNYPSGTAYAWWLMEHFWCTLAKQFTALGGKAYVAFPEIATLSPTLSSAPLKAIELTIPWTTPKERRAAIRFIKRHDIRHIYFTDRPFFSVQYAAIRNAGVRTIVVHDHTPGDRPAVRGLKGAIKALYHRLPWFTADRVFCVSELMRQRNLSNARLAANKCITVQNGITPVACSQQQREATRTELQAEPETLLVVTSGRAHPYKRFDFIINTAKIIQQSNPNLDIRFLLIGDGPAMQELQEQIQRLDLENSIRLLGFRQDVRELLCAADIAMHAALGEGFSLAIIEYMSAGLPVLVPDIPSVCQAINDLETGLIYKWDDIHSAADAILKLAINAEQRRLIGIRAKCRADQQYNLDQCTGSLLEAAAEAFKLNRAC